MSKELDFGLSFFYRVLVPGTLVTAVVSPLVTAILGPVDLGSIAALISAAALGVFVGLLLSLLDDPIYRVYEGRSAWPDWLRRYFTRRLQSHVDDLLQKAARAHKEGDERTYDEIWSELRQFPSDDDEVPSSSAPTRLGNVLASYEEYPWRRYGMDAVFFWPRLWLRLDKDTRDEIDQAWAPADGLMYIAAGLIISGALYLAVVACIVLARIAGIDAPAQPSLLLLGGAGLLLVVGSVVPYRLSLPAHVANGERFKAVFDLQHESLRKELKTPTDDERKHWEDLYQRLQYGEKQRRHAKRPTT